MSYLHALSAMEASQSRYDMYSFIHNVLHRTQGTLVHRAAPAIIPAPYEAAIWVPGRNGSVRVPVERIDWIEAAKDYVLLNTPAKAHMLRATMSDIEKRLDPAIMLRIHRSYFVRIAAVSAARRNGKGTMRLQLNDGRELQVGPSYTAAVVRALKLCL